MTGRRKAQVDGTVRAQSWAPIRSLVTAVAMLLLAVPLTNCQVIDTQAIKDALQNAIDSVNQQSDAWRTALPNLATKLSDLEAQASGDIKVLAGNTLNDVSQLRTETLNQADYLAKDTIAFAAIQLQCSVAYFQQAVASYLTHLKDLLTNSHSPLPPQRVCTFNPDHLDVDPATPATSNRTWPVNVFGYNFFADALPAIQVLDGNNQLVRVGKNQPVPTSIYQIQLQVVVADIIPVAPGYRVGLAWPNHDRNFISVNLSAPAQLHVTALSFPDSVTVNQPVIPHVTVSNTGTADSSHFTISWSPDGNRGVTRTAQVQTLGGGQSQVYDLPSFAYSQQDYFVVPQKDGLHNLQSIVQILGNAGVGPDTQKSHAFTLNDLPFHALPRITITNPNVGADWTSYQQKVGVRPGDIVTVVDAGGCVQTGGSGATWKRYVNPDAADEPNLYHGLVSIVPIMQRLHGAPGHGARILDTLGVPIAVPLNVNPEFWLGYEDGGYGDNGYGGHDDGTNNQCAGIFGAWVTVQIERN